MHLKRQRFRTHIFWINRTPSVGYRKFTEKAQQLFRSSMKILTTSFHQGNLNMRTEHHPAYGLERMYRRTIKKWIL
jgi:cobyrinic acid a,c-diamide synthase